MENLDGIGRLVAEWVLVGDELALARSRRSASARLGFGLMVRFYGETGRLLSDSDDVPGEVIDFIGRQVGSTSSDLEGYRWEGRTYESHRAEVRRFFGFRECSVDDATAATDWLTDQVCERERDAARVRQELLAWCRREKIEPPTDGRIDRIVRSALHRAELALTARIVERLPAQARDNLEDLVAVPDEIEDVLDDDESVWSMMLTAPGNVSLNSMLTEIDKLKAVRAIGLPPGLFVDVAQSVIAQWRSRASVESPSHLRSHPYELRLSMLAALLVVREREIIDALVDLLIATVHRIRARAGRKVTKELTNAFKRVTGKENILFSIAEAALATPDEPVREVVFPAVSGGEGKLQELVHKFRTKGPQYHQTVRATLKASYTSHYRRGLIELLDVLEFHSNNQRHRPVLEALDLVKRHSGAGTRYLPVGETISIHSGVTGDWKLSVFVDVAGKQRVKRPAYEICMFQALRDQLRCKEVWVVGSERWRNPDEDLPAEIDERRTEHYRVLSQPLDPAEFVADLRAEMEHELDALNEGIAGMDWVDIADRGRRGAIRLSPLAKMTEPTNLRKLKRELSRRWGVVQMIDMLKEAVLRSGCLDQVTTRATRGDLDAETLAERLLLVIYAYGTNTGIRAVAGGEHGHSEDDLRYVRRRYLTPDIAQAIAIVIANATLAARRTDLWGTGSSTGVITETCGCRV